MSGLWWKSEGTSKQGAEVCLEVSGLSERFCGRVEGLGMKRRALQGLRGLLALYFRHCHYTTTTTTTSISITPPPPAHPPNHPPWCVVHAHGCTSTAMQAADHLEHG